MSASNAFHILYLDDEQMNLDGFYYTFMDDFQIHTTNSPQKAFELLCKFPIHIVITDQRMPEISGTDFIKKVKDINPTAMCIILTAYADLDVIMESINSLKIFGYVKKPFNEHEMRQLLKSAFESYLLKEKNSDLIKELKTKNEKLLSVQKQLEAENIILKQESLNYQPSDFITQNETMKQLLAQIAVAAESDAPVLLQGETGTGKELIARTIHELSNRKSKSMVTLNCAALPESLIESELFGYEKGAFTGANASKPGRFELADGGTLFLDEVGELPVQLQPKLLRAIQQGEFEKLGGTQTIKTDVRIIAATNRKLVTEVNEKRFRSDLYYRINVFQFQIPPLRERSDDISLLLEAFVSKFNNKYKKNVSIIPKSIVNKLKAYSWPGNIRELENLTERAVITSQSQTLFIENLGNPGDADTNDELLKLIDVEKTHIEKILNRTHWRIRGEGGAAKLLDMKPTTLHSKIKKLGITKE